MLILLCSSHHIERGKIGNWTFFAHGIKDLLYGESRTGEARKGREHYSKEMLILCSYNHAERRKIGRNDFLGCGIKALLYVLAERGEAKRDNATPNKPESSTAALTFGHLSYTPENLVSLFPLCMPGAAKPLPYVNLTSGIDFPSPGYGRPARKYL